MRFTFFLLLYASIASGQNELPLDTDTLPKDEYRLNEIIDLLKRKFEEEAATYCLKMGDNTKLSGPKHFTDKTEEIFATVVTANADIVQYGSAFAYVKDKDANTLSVNGAVNMGTDWILDLGVGSKLEGKDYNFYAENSWSNDVIGSLGISYGGRRWVKNKGEDADNYLTPCERLKAIRSIFISDSILTRYNKLLNWKYDPALLAKPLTSQFREFKELQAGIDNNDELIKIFVASTIMIEKLTEMLYSNYTYSSYSDTNYKIPASDKKTVSSTTTNKKNQRTTGITTIDERKTEDLNIVITETDVFRDEVRTTIEPVKRDIKKELAEVVDIRSTVVELLLLRDNKKNRNLEEFITSKLKSFDKTNDLFTGYRIFWLTLKTYTTNSTINLSSQDLIDQDVHDKIESLYKFSVEGSFNWSYSKKIFGFAKIYTRINRSSLLDSYSLKENGFNISPLLNEELQTIGYNIVDDEGNFVAKYSDLKTPVYNGDVGAYFAVLPFAKRTFGFSAQANLNFPFKNAGIHYKPTYTAIVGLIAKAKKDGVIVNLGAGVDNRYHLDKVWENAVVKASVGVPFAIFEKKKEDKK